MPRVRLEDLVVVPSKWMHVAPSRFACWHGGRRQIYGPGPATQAQGLAHAKINTYDISIAFHAKNSIYDILITFRPILPVTHELV